MYSHSLLKNLRKRERESRAWIDILDILMWAFFFFSGLIAVSVTAKLTSDAQANAGDEGVIPEPDTWFQKKKKAFEKGNRRARRATRKACKSQWMFWLIIILVFLNTCVLATEHYRQPAWLDDFQEYTNMFFVVLFTCEMFLKMYSLGFQVSKSHVNYFDMR